MSALLAAGVSRGGEPVALLAVSPVAGAFCRRRADGVGLGLRRRRRVFAAGARRLVRLSCIPCVLLAVWRRRVAGRWSWFGSSGHAFALQGMQVCTPCARHTKPRCDQAVATGQLIRVCLRHAQLSFSTQLHTLLCRLIWPLSRASS